MDFKINKIKIQPILSSLYFFYYFFRANFISFLVVKFIRISKEIFYFIYILSRHRSPESTRRFVIGKGEGPPTPPIGLGFAFRGPIEIW